MSKHPNNLIYVYTRADAIKDGVLIEAGFHEGEQICITDNLMKRAGLHEDKKQRDEVVKKAIEALSVPQKGDWQHKRLRTFSYNKMVCMSAWIKFEGYTIMLPSDY